MRKVTAFMAIVLFAVPVQAASPNPDTIMTYFIQEDENDPNSDVIMTMRLELKTLATGTTGGVDWTDYNIERVVFNEWINGGTLGRVWSENFPNLKSGYSNFRVEDGVAVSPPIDDNATSAAPLVSNMDIDTADGGTGITFENSALMIIFIDPDLLLRMAANREPVEVPQGNHPTE